MVSSSLLAVCYVLYKTTPVQEVIPDLDEEDSALDNIAVSDESDHENEEDCGLQVLNKYSKV